MWRFRRVFHHIARLLAPKLDLHFSRDDSNQFLPWIIGFLVFLTALALSAGITLNSTIVKSSLHYSGAVTVVIPHSDGLDAEIEKTEKLLRDIKGVHAVARVSQAEMKKLVEPWLGDGKALDALPLPAMLEAEVASGTPDENEALVSHIRDVIRKSMPNVEVESEQEWAGQFSSFTRSLQLVAYLVAGLIVLSSLAMIVMGAKTGLKLHARTVTLLHQIGAKNHYIARQFEVNALLLALKGAAIGSLLALLLFVTLGFAASFMDTALLPDISLTASHWVMFLLLPLITSLAALLSARVTVMSLLRKLP